MEVPSPKTSYFSSSRFIFIISNVYMGAVSAHECRCPQRSGAAGSWSCLTGVGTELGAPERAGVLLTAEIPVQ